MARHTYEEAEAEWPKLPTPPEGAPNIVVILLDDVGYGQTGTFGRFGIDTFGVGEDTGSPVVHTYKPPFPFTGTIEKVEIDLK